MKLIDSTEPVRPRNDGWKVTIQLLDQEKLLVLNIWNNRHLHARHCLNLETGEYATRKKEWTKGNIWEALSMSGESWKSNEYYYYSPRSCPVPGRFILSQRDNAYLKERIPYTGSVFDRIGHLEREYGRCKRELTEKNRFNRAQNLMGQVPAAPSIFPEWIINRLAGDRDYFIKNLESGLWNCTHCGKQSPEQNLKRADGEKKIRHNDAVICPRCRKVVQILKRNKGRLYKDTIYLIQPIDQDKSVMRQFRAEVDFNCDMAKKVYYNETIRLVFFKTEHLNLMRRKKDIGIYYLQYRNYFDDKGNPCQERWYPGYLFDGGAEKALENTAYAEWGRIFRDMAKTDAKASFDALLCSKEAMDVAEMLSKGRFFRLLEEMSAKITIPDGHYYGTLNLGGRDIREVFGISDMQRINRIRDKNGGEKMLNWLQYQEEAEVKLPDKVLDWLIRSDFDPSPESYKSLSLLRHGFTPEQAMNYVERQRKESYTGKSTWWVSVQYADYIRMAEQLGKDVRDEMVYRPRELKRRHDEAVEEFKQREAEIRAAEYSKKYGEAEKVLHEIRQRYEYSGEDYMIIVPQLIADIVKEGNALHHCAGATDRYFDRIKQQETYICFLRKTEEPDKPFYTIEVEPGGTIRQHRGMYDEEPDIDKIKPFLRKWQQEIRRRMKKRDHELAAVSAKKREENIADLRAKNNTRVLQGLLEDFMEAAGI